jgi:CheY-like chemotaxis protein
VLLDLNMPGMSGQETLYELRKLAPDLEVVVSSGYGEEQAMNLFSGQQVSGFIQKPLHLGAVAGENRPLAWRHAAWGADAVAAHARDTR